MKIGDSQPPRSESDADTNSVDSSPGEEKDEPSSFSRLLLKKELSSQAAAQSKGGKPGQGEFETIVSVFMQMPKSFDRSIQTAQVESKHVVALPPELQQLVREISVVVNAAGSQQVNIELNSNVLRGLHIRIEKHDGAVAIQFQSASEQVLNLLSRNVDSLSQALADRGVTVGKIRVSDPKEASESGTYKNGASKSGSRGQHGRQGGRK